MQRCRAFSFGLPGKQGQWRRENPTNQYHSAIHQSSLAQRGAGCHAKKFWESRKPADHKDLATCGNIKVKPALFHIAISGIGFTPQAYFYWMIRNAFGQDPIDQEETCHYSIHEFYSPMAVHPGYGAPQHPPLRSRGSCSAACCWGRPCLNDQPSCGTDRISLPAAGLGTLTSFGM